MPGLSLVAMVVLSWQQAKDPPRKLYFGVSACAACHTTPEPFKDDPPVLCRCDEVTRWEKEDKHKDAFNNLHKARGRQIIALLGYSTREVEKNCVSCHGAYVEDKKLRGRGYKLEDGVSCALCHGPFDKWVDEHGGVAETSGGARAVRRKSAITG